MQTDKNLLTDDKEKLKLAATDFIVNDLRPFEAICGDGLLNFASTIWNLGAKYGATSSKFIEKIIPSPQTVSRRVSTDADAYKTVILKSLEYCANKNGLGITTDLWQDKFKRITYMSLTAHFFNDTENEMRLEDQIFCMQPFEASESKNATNLRKHINDKLIEFNLLQHASKIVFVSDRGPNVTKALEIYTRLNCYPHLSNNIAEKACDVADVKLILESARKLVRFFKISGLNNLLKKSLKSFVKTRFNSNCSMLESILDNWDDIITILEQRGESERINVLTQDSINEIFTFLKEFKRWSDQLECSLKPSLHLVWIAAESVKIHLQLSDFDSPMITEMKKIAIEYFRKNFVLHKYHRIATFLNPQTKNMR